MKNTNLSTSFSEIEKTDNISGFHIHTDKRGGGYMATDTFDISFDQGTASPHRQILLHEAFHVYQVLTSELLSSYSWFERDFWIHKFKKIVALVEEGHRFSRGEKVLSLRTTSYNDKSIQDLLKRITSDYTEYKKKIFSVNQTASVSMLDIIEGAAVNFQLIADEDYFDTKIGFELNVYNQSFNVFCKATNCDMSSESAIRYARIVFLFMSDVYLRHADRYFDSPDDFEKCAELSIPILDAAGEFESEFLATDVRERRFSESLSQVEEDADLVQILLDLCGNLEYEQQKQLFVFVRIYAELHKRITLAGSGQFRLNNKNEAINRKLEKLFPYWRSKFIVPYILSNSNDVDAFSLMWREIDDVSFLGDGGDYHVTVREEKRVLNFVKNFEDLISTENRKVFCCSTHCFRQNTANAILTCSSTDSMNQQCRDFLGRSLGDFMEVV